MKYLTLIMILCISMGMMQTVGDDLKVIYDPRPEMGIPEEARRAGTQLIAGAEKGSKPGVAFSTVTDLNDYGPLRAVINQGILVITVRYLDSSFTDIKGVETYLKSILQSEAGSTMAFCPWAEGLSIPAIEAQIQFASGGKGKWLIWRGGRSVYRDPDKKWWFTYGWKEPD